MRQLLGRLPVPAAELTGSALFWLLPPTSTYSNVDTIAVTMYAYTMTEFEYFDWAICRKSGSMSMFCPHERSSQHRAHG